MSDSDTIRVPKARLREVKAEIDGLTVERDQLRRDLAALREEHDNLRAHLTGSIREIAKLKEQLDHQDDGATEETLEAEQGSEVKDAE
ncbi:MAG: hypothetical protein AAGI52_15885 [Bacteroidota bacterium]